MNKIRKLSFHLQIKLFKMKTMQTWKTCRTLFKRIWKHKYGILKQSNNNELAGHLNKSTKEQDYTILEKYKNTRRNVLQLIFNHGKIYLYKVSHFSTRFMPMFLFTSMFSSKVPESIEIQQMQIHMQMKTNAAEYSKVLKYTEALTWNGLNVVNVNWIILRVPKAPFRLFW